LPKPRPSFTKRQREQAKRDRQVQKAERRAQRKNEKEVNGPDDQMGEWPENPDQDPETLPS
jgi:hypothetical protein